MRDKELVMDGSPCTENFFDKSLQTAGEAKRRGPTECQNYGACEVGKGKLHCIMLAGIEVARVCISNEKPVDLEIREFHGQEDLRPPHFTGYIKIEDGKEIILTDWGEICNKVAKFAKLVLDLRSPDHTSFGAIFTLPKKSCIYEYPILGESIWDEDGSQWMHRCGTILMQAKITHPIHNPLSGGEVWTERAPYCPHCGKIPGPFGAPTKSNPYDDLELEIFKRARKSNQ